jgi:hypothetical protein
MVTYKTKIKLTEVLSVEFIFYSLSITLYKYVVIHLV